ncbi:septation protein SepH [Nocardiopsis sp. MG754419]|uniref:septation protein SepH n=1 Tax=Nocardiopsis sp. MG754419 TaxID=2259865 RepID=UPI001BAB8FD8|nr:septation protein SepH [Nocardiopsis sp. MG754419]MBR8741780.1 DUF3071 domain-containing protein [Nocardiopsis sp. MG754419]
MHELRLVAVSEDGTYLVLASAGRGTRFMLPVDDRLRAAVRGQFSRLGQYEIEVENPLRPKEIQARIRSGETAEAISEISGIPIERVRWFEGPVLQEREYIAQQAQRATVRAQGDAAPGPSLEEIVTKRIGAHQLETGDAEWDSWKREDRTWQLKLVFLHGGDERVAHWLYEPRHNTVTPADEEAARFSSGEPLGSPLAPGANVTPFAPRRNEATTDLPRLDAQSAAERRHDHVAPRRLSPAQDTPLDEPLRPASRTDPFGAPGREESRRPAQNRPDRGPERGPAPEPERAPAREPEPRTARGPERTPQEAPPAAPLPGVSRNEPPRRRSVEEPPMWTERPTDRPTWNDHPTDRPTWTEPAAERPERHERPERPERPRPVAEFEAPAAEQWRRAEPQVGPERPTARPSPAQHEHDPEPAPPAEPERPRRRRATIDLNDTGTPRRAPDEQPSMPAATSGPTDGGGATPKRKGRGRRASVPSWDEIMFGSKKNE